MPIAFNAVRIFFCIRCADGDPFKRRLWCTSPVLHFPVPSSGYRPLLLLSIDADLSHQDIHLLFQRPLRCSVLMFFRIATNSSSQRSARNIHLHRSAPASASSWSDHFIIGMVSLFSICRVASTSIDILDVCTDISIHTDLKVGHPPGKIGMFQKFTQQPMIEIPIP